ncbi:MAG TPA: hypothetical protein VK034_02460 [Enhygromyxa sp.]|nr:hypothetical protein [Enhygromyxa sp.]
MDIRIQDEALFVVPGSGALWSYDFGSEKRVIREAHDEASDPPFQVAQARADDFNLLLVFPTLGAPTIAEQHTIRRLLAEHAGSCAVAFVLSQAPGHVALVGSDTELVEHFAAAVAVVRTCWGWDESQVFTVVVDELEFTVAPRFDGEVWTARPEAVSRGRARL